MHREYEEFIDDAYIHGSTDWIGYADQEAALQKIWEACQCHDLAERMARINQVLADEPRTGTTGGSMITTTLNKIRDHSPCQEGWGKLLKHLGKTKADDEPLPFAVIVESNGLDDALWCCRTAPERDREWRLFAVWCARRVQHLMIDPRSVAALDVAERFARGEATVEELAAARDAAWDAVRAAARAAAGGAAWYAVWAAVWAAAGDAAWDAAWDAAGVAAWAAAEDAVRAAQTKRFLEVVS